MKAKSKGIKTRAKPSPPPLRRHRRPEYTAEQLIQRERPVRPTDVARCFDLSEGHVYRMIDIGKIPTHRIGRAIRIPLWWFKQKWAALGDGAHPQG
jgi:excisionase family DNA binding protein